MSLGKWKERKEASEIPGQSSKNKTFHPQKSFTHKHRCAETLQENKKEEQRKAHACAHTQRAVRQQ